MNRALRSAWLRWDRWLSPRVPAARLGAFRALVAAVALYDVLLYAPVVFGDAARISGGEPLRPWTPIYLFQVLGVGPIGLPAAHALQAVAIAALAAAALGLATRLACAVGAVTFLWWTGLAYSFGKPHHDKVALAFALAALPFARAGTAVSLDAVLARWWGRPVRPRWTSGMAIRITQITLAIGYGGAGLAKVWLGGPDWFNGYTLQGIMLGHDGDWSRWLAADVLGARVQSIGVVGVQVLFPLVLIWPRLCWFFLPAATSFHLLTWKTMDTGPYMRVWLLLFAFVPMERIPATLHRWLSAGPVAALVTALLVAGYAALVFEVARVVVPEWALAGTCVFLLLALARFRRAAAARASLE